MSTKSKRQPALTAIQSLLDSIKLGTAGDNERLFDEKESRVEKRIQKNLERCSLCFTMVGIELQSLLLSSSLFEGSVCVKESTSLLDKRFERASFLNPFFSHALQVLSTNSSTSGTQ